MKIAHSYDYNLSRQIADFLHHNYSADDINRFDDLIQDIRAIWPQLNVRELDGAVTMALSDFPSFQLAPQPKDELD